MSESTKLVLLIVVGVLVAGALVTGAYLGYEKTARLQKETISVQEKVDTENAKLIQVPELKKQEANLSDTVTRYEQILPNSRELVNIVNFFNIAREGSGIEYLSSLPVKPKLSNKKNAVKVPYEKHSFEITFRCNFEQFVTFINLLETQPRFMQVEKFTLVDGGGKAEDLGARIMVSTYRFDPEAAKPKPSSRRRSSSSRRRS